MNYRVVYTKQLIADLDAKIRYLRAQHVSEQTIARWFDGLYDRIESLTEVPCAFGVDPDASEKHGRLLRKLTYDRHIIRYRVDDNTRTVYVLSFIHGARRPDA